MAVVDGQGVELAEQLGHPLRLLQVSLVLGRRVEHGQPFDGREVTARVAVAVGAAGAILGLASRVAKLLGRGDVEVAQPLGRRQQSRIVVLAARR